MKTTDIIYRSLFRYHFQNKIIKTLKISNIPVVIVDSGRILLQRVD